MRATESAQKWASLDFMHRRTLAHSCAPVRLVFASLDLLHWNDYIKRAGKCYQHYIRP